MPIHLLIQRKPQLFGQWRWLGLLWLLAFCCATTSVAQAQTKTPSPAAPIKPAAVNEDTQPVGSISNEFIKVEVNKRGQFVIKTTGGDPNVIGDENKTLLYDDTIGAPPGVWGTNQIWGSSFTTFRSLRTGGWAYRATNFLTYRPLKQRFSTDRIVTEWYVFDYCEFYATQTLSFMTNPYTGRKDMVKIEYRMAIAEEVVNDIGAPVCNPPLLSGRYGVRLLLDTMIGDNDLAPFFIPGIGNTDRQHDFTGNLPPFFRVFESPTYERNSLQAIGYLLPVNSLSPSQPDRMVIAAWEDIYQRDDHTGPFQDDLLWHYTVPADTPHGDSAVALYWSDRSTPSDIYFNFGYGLAPQGGAIVGLMR